MLTLSDYALVINLKIRSILFWIVFISITNFFIANISKFNIEIQKQLIYDSCFPTLYQVIKN